jgi:transglutaminase-like putative cysteine protease
LTAGVVRLRYSIDLRYEIADHPAEFVFNVHAASTPRQRVVAEAFALDQPVASTLHEEPVSGNRYLRLTARPGPLHLRYDATVDITHHLEPPVRVGEVGIGDLPSEVLPFLYPSRYCQSDRLGRLAAREFGHLRQGYWRVQAIADWVAKRITFTSGRTHASTSAVDTLVEQVGVCRDFAHLMIALCRAVNVPARFVTGIDYGAPPEMGPPDFHAYVEAYLGGRWYLFDPTGISPPMGLVRIGTGRDAAEVSFATMFGSVKTNAPAVGIEAMEDAANGFLLPRHCTDAVSSSGPTEVAASY